MQGTRCIATFASNPGKLTRVAISCSHVHFAFGPPASWTSHDIDDDRDANTAVCARSCCPCPGCSGDAAIPVYFSGTDSSSGSWSGHASSGSWSGHAEFERYPFASSLESLGGGGSRRVSRNPGVCTTRSRGKYTQSQHLHSVLSFKHLLQLAADPRRC